MKTWISASAAALGLGACGMWNAGTHISSGQIGDSQYVATTADLRLIFSRPKQTGQNGANPTPGAVSTSAVLCAEPSPDVAKALSDALTANANANAQGLKALGGSGASLTVAQSVAATQNATLMTLGSRLATTQLMRDGVYRLCEAYANGAISSYEYGMVISRYGDTMVTLLSIEALSGIATAEAGQTTSTNATLPNAAPGGGQGATPGAAAGAGAAAPAADKHGDSGISDSAHIADNTPHESPATQGTAPARQDAVAWPGTLGETPQDSRQASPRPYLTPIAYRSTGAYGFIKTAAPVAAAPNATPPLPAAGAAQPAHAAPAAAKGKHGAAATPASDAAAKKARQANNAKKPAAGAQQAQPANNGTGSGNTMSTAAAIVKLQENYLAQSVNAPVIVLCTQVLAENLDSSSGAELKKECGELMTAYAKHF